MYEYQLTEKITSPACVCDVDFGKDRSVILRVRHESLDKLVKDGFLTVHQLDGRGRRTGVPVIGTVATNPAPIQVSDSKDETEITSSKDPLEGFSEEEKIEIRKALELIRNKPQS
jgi:hypothetical protein